MLSVKTIACPKCGQLVNINADETFSEEELNLKALSECSCPDARKYRAVESQIQEAQSNMFRLCADGSQKLGLEPIADDEIFDFLKKAIELVGHDKILDINLRLSGFGVVKIKSTPKAQIKVTRVVGIHATLEANQKY